ncbi:MAG: preprotein translocase subunit SecG [Bdellovibrionia bacterium]
MQTLITVVHIFTCVLIVLLVLIQSGKGAEISTSFAGSSQTVFGSSGGANFFTRLTSGAAAVFMVTSLTLTLLGGQSKKSLFESMSGNVAPNPAATQQVPAAAAPVTSQTGTPAK